MINGFRVYNASTPLLTGSRCCALWFIIGVSTPCVHSLVTYQVFGVKNENNVTTL